VELLDLEGDRVEGLVQVAAALPALRAKDQPPWSRPQPTKGEKPL
jgi:hypothetical protein